MTAGVALAAEPNAAPEGPINVPAASASFRASAPFVAPPAAAAVAQANPASPGEEKPELLEDPPKPSEPSGFADQPDTAPPFAPTGSVEAGFGFDSLTAGYQNWNSQFVRGVYTSDPKNTWNWEVVNAREFGGHGVLLVGGNTHVINDDWYVSTFLNTSTGGFFLPRYRADATVNRKFLKSRSLVIGTGLSAVKAQDVHRDTAVLLEAAYYFESPWVIQGDVRMNSSNPGSVRTNYYTVAAIYGRDKDRYISLSYGQGREGYQVVGDAAGGNSNILSDFPSRTALLTWRQWVKREWGFQVRVGHYSNPYYRRVGGEFSLFWDF